MNKIYINHLCIATLAGTLFACGGGGGGGGSSTSSSSGGTATPSPAANLLPFAQTLAAQEASKPMEFSTTLSGFAGDTIANRRMTNEQAKVTFTKNATDSEQYDVSITIGNNTPLTYKTISGSDPNIYIIGSGSPELENITSSSDTSFKSSLNGTPSGEFQFLRRFSINDGNTSSTNRFSRKFGVIGLKTPVTSIPTAGAPATYRGSLGGQYTSGASGIHNFTRSATFNVDFAGKTISGEFGAPSVQNETTPLGNNTLLATGGSISGDGFTITKLAIQGSNANPFNNVTIRGNFYGTTGQELGGTVNYFQNVDGGLTRAVGGAFGATQQ